jgi:anti-sigma factor RsiW
MTEKHSTDALSDYLNDDLSQAERLEIEGHLSACAECRAVLEGLRAVVGKAGGLEDSSPTSDLWADIAKAIKDAPQEDEQVIDLSTRMASPKPVEIDRRVRLTLPQLAAASLIMMMASGALAWSVRPATEGAGVVSEVPAAMVVPASLVDRPALAGYTQEVAQLEALIADHRDELAPNTVRILEKNLAIIDRAIEESAAALSSDPGNEYLLEHLGRAFERKVDYLRDARDISGWSTS